MSSNLNIFEQTACLSDEQLLLYVSGKMNAEEKRKAELHLADCDMCADAVEGLQLTHNKNIAAINEKLHSAIDMRLSKTATIIPFYRKYLTTIISAAALVAVTVGLYFIVQLQTKTDNVSELKQQVNADTIILKDKHTEPQAAVANDTVYANTDSQLQATVAGKKEETMQRKFVPAISANEESVSQAENDNNKGFVATEDESVDRLDAQKDDATSKQFTTTGSVSNYQSGVLADSTIKFNSNYSAATLQREENTELKEVAVMKKSNARNKAKAETKSIEMAPQSIAADQKKVSIDMSVYTNAIQLYNEKKYAEARSAFNSLLLQEPTQPASNYYAGMCDFYLNDFKKAAQHLEYATGSSITEFYEPALYHKGLCYLNLKENKKARKSFEAVVKLNGIYKKQAEEKLLLLK